MPHPPRSKVHDKKSSRPGDKHEKSFQHAGRINPHHLLQRAYADPSTLTPSDLKHLQRTVGNRATVDLVSRSTGLQAKLALGPAGDRYEREADRVSQQVVRQMDAPQPMQSMDEGEGLVQPKRAGRGGYVLQRQNGPAAKRSFARPAQRPIPLISSISQVQRAPALDAEEDERLQRQTEGEEVEEEELVQTKSLHGPEGGEVEQSVEQQIQAARGGGKPLDRSVRGSMEQSFGADFGDVRIHTGAQADTLNRSLNSRAFTVGKDIFFRGGEYAPSASSGKQLLAHELTHTVQQSGGSVQREVIQRAIGFEFEFGTWKTFHKDSSRLDKGEEIYRGNGYKVEGEDAEGDVSAIEIVTKPYVNVDEAVASVQDAQKWMRKVSAASVLSDGRVHASSFGGKSGIRILPGSNKGKMQASPAFSLDRMPALYKRAGGTYAGYANSIANYMSRDDVKHKYLSDSDATAELVGLVTLIVDYLTQGASKAQLSYPKSAFRIMARTSFTKMFKLVPEFEFFRQPDNLDKWVNLVLEVAAAINPSIGKEITPSQLVPRQVTKRKWWGKQYTKTVWDQIDAVTRDKTLDEIGNERVLNMNLIGMEPQQGDQDGSVYKLNLTRDDWLRSMITEDKLSKAKDKRFEGMGAYGDATDVEVLEDEAEVAVEKAVVKSGIDDLSERGSLSEGVDLSEDVVERSDESNEEEVRAPKQAALFELRGLGDMFGINQDITLDKWTSKVRQVFAIVDEVNQKSFAPGGKPTVPDDVDNPGGWTRQ